MSQNLDLDLQDNITLTKYDTDLNTIDEWTPTASPEWAAAHPTNDASRGTTIITQKESLGEYGSGWEWDKDWQETTHVFDQEATIIDNSGQVRIIPYTYASDGTLLTDCSYSMEITNGELLSSSSNMTNQVSCKANTGNAGNWYSWPASTAGGQSSSLELNSICPRGWQLTTNASMDIRSYDYLIRTIYDVFETNSDSKIRPLPMSFIRSGYYYLGPLNDRGSRGGYWSALSAGSAASFYLNFLFNSLDTQHGSNSDVGFSVRCVSR